MLRGGFFFFFYERISWKYTEKVSIARYQTIIIVGFLLCVFHFQLCLQTFVGNALPVFRHKIIIYRGVIEKWKVIDLAESYVCMRYTDTVLVSKEELGGIFVFHLLKSEQCWMYYIHLEHLLTY